MSTTTLHYIFDPLCGWCYGAAPLVDAARAVPGLAIALHGGGMMVGSHRRKIDAQWRGHVIEHDARIAAMTGQPFGEAYINGLLLDTTAMMDSAPPTCAILAAEKLDGQGLEMLHLIQVAHYQQGKRVADMRVLEGLAQEAGFPVDEFMQEMALIETTTLADHIAQSRALLAKVQGPGFPTFVLEDAQGQLHVLPVGQYLGDAKAWQALLHEYVSAR
ncbi:DsbA family protein [Buttiauxella sp. WJP83]|uniref:DsbA family protein n=1 Tax=Buttiauxella sp. WJP83 TaxID=2986951 RepID=UPI0022DD3BC3|nr:DsbA family protein [Buttiauxella sp. WJP83]WBM69702.1 DsbA family protein [Buttiauxella sp. WJP83]